ncbi:hypothetical protein SUGI_0130820 [Cryptomeria japonica]|uniref:protein SMALL AUXIN UP-REGULATED RNA 10 n=1 Tax=Cryptomeria japonica TaxID=3369 RepID=UPI002408A8D7|nr:protein SMALL AUXIN UP-REGULATED RNA 10 [Cryptomeria japonica]GLJ10566.1 hypothetical protein SUGI_0130820 [Cryptomeria japonica]
MNKWQSVERLKVGGQMTRNEEDKVSFGCTISPRFKSRRHCSYDSDEEVSSSPRDVKEGYLAVYVGAERKRFVIPTAYLSLPVFRTLLEMAAEEFGFVQKGGLTLPCDVTFFKQILKLLKRNDPAYMQMGLNDIVNCIVNDRERQTDALCSSKPLGPFFGASLQKSFG